MRAERRERGPRKRLGVQRAAVGRGAQEGADARRAFVTVSTSSANVQCPVSSVRCPVRASSVHACLSTRPLSSVRFGHLSVQVSGVQCPGSGVRCPRAPASAVSDREAVERGGEAGSRIAGMAGISVVTTSVYDRLLDYRIGTWRSRLAHAVLGQRRRRLGLGRRPGSWLTEAGSTSWRPRRSRMRARIARCWERGSAARWRLRFVVIVSGLGPSRLVAAGVPGWTASCACGRSAAATCGERRPLEADDALTCGFRGGGEGI
jgi:hypothetical protein